jgi:hypothetical protein
LGELCPNEAEIAKKQVVLTKITELLTISEILT